MEGILMTGTGHYKRARLFSPSGVSPFIIWPCLKRTGNKQIQEIDLDRGLDFPI